KFLIRRNHNRRAPAEGAELGKLRADFVDKGIVFKNAQIGAVRIIAWVRKATGGVNGHRKSSHVRPENLAVFRRPDGGANIKGAHRRRGRTVPDTRPRSAAIL